MLSDKNIEKEKCEKEKRKRENERNHVEEEVNKRSCY